MPSSSLLTSLVASVSVAVAETPAAPEEACELAEVGRLYEALDGGAAPSRDREALRDELIRRSDACARSEDPSDRVLALGAYALVVRVAAPGPGSSPPGDCAWFGRARAFASELTEAQPQNGDVAQRRGEIEEAWAGSGCGEESSVPGREVTAGERGGGVSPSSGDNDRKLRSAAITTGATAGVALVVGVGTSVAAAVLQKERFHFNYSKGYGKCQPDTVADTVTRDDCLTVTTLWNAAMVSGGVFVGTVIATGVIAGVYRKRRQRSEAVALRWAPIVAPSRSGVEIGAALRF